MDCRVCGGPTTIIHSEQTSTNGIKRRRLCRECDFSVVTYERGADDIPNELEQRLVDTYRALGKEPREALWATIRALKPPMQE